ncbi:transposase [Streptomyces sp. NRRL S-813]|uniref:transposase n=1 Tax=Streptomyces sp. NRRL S-813 TaxID=1463919 RepID=UPI00099CB897|nr:transposase [Streptomyces sp. NRRL S-813]
MGRDDLTDEQRAVLEPLLPKGARAGRPPVWPRRQLIDGIRFRCSHDKLTSRIGVPFMGLAAKTPASSLKYPMSLAGKMSALANDPGAMKVFMKDRTSAANWVSVRFLDRYLNYAPAIELADFDACPVLLAQPAEDRWSPHHLSLPVLSHITKVPVDTVMLDNAGHYPLEELGLQQMQDAIADFVTKHTT